MKVVHVLRKPLSDGSVAANVLKHGTGALNIDASRISTGDSLGRWPANLILQHLDGCRCVGTTRVKGIGGGATSGDNAFGQESGWNAHENKPVRIHRQRGEDGLEAVAAWNCAPGCPVPALDAQSGITKSSGGRAYQNTNDMYDGGWGKGSGVAADPGYGDVGGVSRYYKQVGGHDDDPAG